MLFDNLEGRREILRPEPGLRMATTLRSAQGKKAKATARRAQRI